MVRLPRRTSGARVLMSIWVLLFLCLTPNLLFSKKKNVDSESDVPGFDSTAETGRSPGKKTKISDATTEEGATRKKKKGEAEGEDLGEGGSSMNEGGLTLAQALADHRAKSEVVRNRYEALLGRGLDGETSQLVRTALEWEGNIQNTLERLGKLGVKGEKSGGLVYAGMDAKRSLYGLWVDQQVWFDAEKNGNQARKAMAMGRLSVIKNLKAALVEADKLLELALKQAGLTGAADK